MLAAFRSHAFYAVFMAAVTGCAVGPNFHEPQAPKDAGDTAALYQALVGGWWNRNTAVSSTKGSAGAAAPAPGIDLISGHVVATGTESEHLVRVCGCCGYWCRNG